ncbi:MAG: MBL fold metallo-hydrolase [Deltaproteobacteria bacterium]|nr:MBL fold metallo-hydrolase [Deltaproteobacteria bacterium]
MRHFVIGIILGSFVLVASAATIRDGESASHGDEAATYRIVDTYRFDGFELVQFNLAVLSHYSYILISAKEALIVDPGRDVDVYLTYCEKRGLKIKGVFLTHSHADFVAGHSELAQVPGVAVYSGIHSGAKFPHKSVKQGSRINIGTAVVTVWETPGHTPDGLCGIVGAGDGPPQLALTGDTLFIGSVGRPDLMGGKMSAASLAAMGFDTWMTKLSTLPDSVAIFPAHGAGSLCGAHLSDAPTSTIGEQRKTNPYLQYTSRNDFITAVLDGLPEAPAYFKHNAAMNQNGPPLVDWTAPPAQTAATDTLTDPSKYYVVDVRDAASYAEKHIPNSVNIGLRGRIETWVGIMVPWDAELVLTGSETELDEAVQRLHRVGYEGKVLAFKNWEKSGLKTRRNDLMTAEELRRQMIDGKNPIIVDVRLPTEWMGLRIGQVINIPLNKLAEQSTKLNAEEPVVAVCNSAFRSSMAVGILERNGFSKAVSLKGGSQAWIEAGYPTYSTQMTQSLASTKVENREIEAPERISTDSLGRMMVDMPGSFEIVDIRPPQAFAEYNLPLSANIHYADLITDSHFVESRKPLVIVDRDGSLAMAAGGILSQKTNRRIMVLHGGLTDYWKKSMYGIGQSGTQSEIPVLDVKPASAPVQLPSEAPLARPKTKKKVSAGC